MSVLAGVLAISKYRSTSGRALNDDLVSLLMRGVPGVGHYDYAAAFDLGLQLDWFETDDPQAPWHARLRKLIDELVRTAPPPWRSVVPWGRGVALANMDTENRRCLNDAGLLADDEPTQRWWDEIAAIERAAQADILLGIGRIGERLTIEHEVRRLAAQGRSDLKPAWVALDDNSAGYDVRSWRLAGDEVNELLIEVKASTSSPVLIHITRGEWKVATTGRQHAFYVWNISEERLRILTPAEIAEHAPENRGVGEWESFVLPVDV